jgi:hypothetical protein
MFTSRISAFSLKNLRRDTRLRTPSTRTSQGTENETQLTLFLRLLILWHRAASPRATSSTRRKGQHLLQAGSPRLRIRQIPRAFSNLPGHRLRSTQRESAPHGAATTGSRAAARSGSDTAFSTWARRSRASPARNGDRQQPWRHRVVGGGDPNEELKPWMTSQRASGRNAFARALRETRTDGKSPHMRDEDRREHLDRKSGRTRTNQSTWQSPTLHDGREQGRTDAASTQDSPRRGWAGFYRPALLAPDDGRGSEDRDRCRTG